MTSAPLTDVVALGPQWLDPTYLLPALGPWVLPVACLIVSAECGLLLDSSCPGTRRPRTARATTTTS